jgi:hypothetical protein
VDKSDVYRWAGLEVCDDCGCPLCRECGSHTEPVASLHAYVGWDQPGYVCDCGWAASSPLNPAWPEQDLDGI